MTQPIITMCVIDDIRIVVEGITTQIDWASYGIEICGTALNGEQGIQLIERFRPNIILTDICMPLMDGLELTRRVKEMLPDSKILLLTGFSDFEYAQQAVRLGAFDFITKPFSLEQIEEAVLKAKKALEHDMVKALRVQELEQQVKESMPVLRQEYFNLLIHHRSSEESARKRWEFLQIDMEPEHFAIMVLEIDRFAEVNGELPIQEVELLRFSLQNIVEETLHSYTKGVVFRETSTRFVAVFNVSQKVDPSTIAEKCCEHISKYTRFTVSIGVGQHILQIYELPRSYEQAMSALAYHFYTGGNGVVSIDDISSTETLIPRNTVEKEQMLLYYLRSGNQESALAVLDELFEELMAIDPKPEPEYLVSVLQELGSMMLRAFQEKVPYKDIAAVESRYRDRKTASGTFHDLQRQLKDLCCEGCSLIVRKLTSEANKVIGTAVAYIRDNLHLDLSVNHCAKQVHLSGSYFANLFKRVTGCTFNQFVTQERMERAKTMLMEDYPVQEVADSLGYVERRYFSDVFKKYTNMTPSEFRQHYTSKS